MSERWPASNRNTRPASIGICSLCFGTAFCDLHCGPPGGFCRLHPDRASVAIPPLHRISTRRKTSGNLCATTGSPTACSKVPKPSSTIAATLGENSKTNPGGSCPSVCATGPTGTDQCVLVLDDGLKRMSVFSDCGLAVNALHWIGRYELQLMIAAGLSLLSEVGASCRLTDWVRGQGLPSRLRARSTVCGGRPKTDNADSLTQSPRDHLSAEGGTP